MSSRWAQQASTEYCRGHFGPCARLTPGACTDHIDPIEADPLGFGEPRRLDLHQAATLTAEMVLPELERRPPPGPFQTSSISRSQSATGAGGRRPLVLGCRRREHGVHRAGISLWATSPLTV